MQLNRIGTQWNNETRNKMNEDRETIEGNFNNSVQKTIEEAKPQIIDELVDSAKLNYLSPAVETFGDIESTHPNPDVGDAVNVTSEGKVYRWNGSAWEWIQGIDPGPYNQLDEKIGEINSDLEDRGINVLLNGVAGDGVTDDTQVIQDLINNNSYVVFPIPTGKYRLTDEIIIPSNRTLEFIGGNHWNPSNQREVGFIYDGVDAPDKAMFRLSTSQVGVEPSSALSNVKFKGGCVCDGNSKIGHGFYAAYVINDSSFDKITAINTLKEGIQIEKSWYTVYRDLVAKGNQGNGITVGRNGWGGVNGCLFENIRGHSNGFNGDFTETNYEAGYGVGLYLGSSSKVLNVVSERNYAAGLMYSMGTSDNHSIDTIYLEKNGLQAKADGKTSRNWGVIVKGSLTGTAKEINNLYLGGASTEDVQSIWLANEGSKAPLELRNVGGGSGGVIRAEWDNYRLTGMIGGSIGTNIEGHLPRIHAGTLNSNWTTVYVRNTGSDDNDGRTISTAFASIEKAVEVANSIQTISTINCTDLSVDLVELNLKGIERELTLDGGNTCRIESANNNDNGISLKGGGNTIRLVNFAKITRLTLNDTKCIVENSDLGHTDGAFSGTIEARNSNILLDGSSLDGSGATNATKNGVRLYNSLMTFKTTTMQNYSSGRYITVSEGSQVLADSYMPAFQSVYWDDDTGSVQGGDVFKSAFGTIHFIS